MGVKKRPIEEGGGWEEGEGRSEERGNEGQGEGKKRREGRGSRGRGKRGNAKMGGVSSKKGEAGAGIVIGTVSWSIKSGRRKRKDGET